MCGASPVAIDSAPGALVPAGGSSCRPPALLLVAVLGACTTVPSLPERVGADRDAHGCTPSAGYSWCAREQQCTRPWELAAAKGFESSAPAVKAYCEAGAR